VVEDKGTNSFYLGEQYRSISELADRFGDYHQFKIEYHNLILKKEDDQKVWDVFLVRFLTKVLSDSAKIWINIINTRRTKGQTFVHIRNKLDEYVHKLDTQPYISLMDLQALRNEIGTLVEQCQERMSIERYNKEQFWKGIVVGIIGGAILSWVVAHPESINAFLSR